MDSGKSEEHETGESAAESTEDDDQCPICLNTFTNQWTGIPDACQHVFCMDCILEWSKNSCSCPIDRTEFSNLLIHDKISGVFQRRVPVAPLANSVEDQLEFVCCQICESPESEATLLLCDGCDLGYHCECLSPPLCEVPLNEWFCPACRDERGHSTVATVSSSGRRSLGRTRAVERVREEIQEYRSRRRDIGSQIEEVINSILGRPESWFQAIVDRRDNLPPRKIRRSSKTGRTSSAKRKQKRGRRKCGRAGSKKRNSRTRCRDNSFISPRLSMFGESDNLDVYLARNTQTEPAFLLAQKRRQLSAAAIRFNLPLPSLLTTGGEAEPVQRTSPEPIADLLGQIIQEQEILGLPCRSISIQTNGSLVKCNHSRSPCSPIQLVPKKEITSGGSSKVNEGCKILTAPAVAPADTSTSRDSSSSHKKSSGGKTESSSSSRHKDSSCAKSSRSEPSSSGSSQAKVGKGERASAATSSSSAFKDSNLQNTNIRPALGERNSKPAKSMRKIKIKRITVLPLRNSDKQEKNAHKIEAYDPFNPTDEETMESSQGNDSTERTIYDPFQPTVSDEEKDDSTPALGKNCSDGAKKVGKPASVNENIRRVDPPVKKLSKASPTVGVGCDLGLSCPASPISAQEIDMFAEPEQSPHVKTTSVAKLHTHTRDDGDLEIQKRLGAKDVQEPNICTKPDDDVAKCGNAAAVGAGSPNILGTPVIKHRMSSPGLGSVEVCRKKHSKHRNKVGDSSLISLEKPKVVCEDDSPCSNGGPPYLEDSSNESPDDEDCLRTSREKRDSGVRGKKRKETNGRSQGRSKGKERRESSRRSRTPQQERPRHRSRNRSNSSSFSKRTDKRSKMVHDNRHRSSSPEYGCKDSYESKGHKSHKKRYGSEERTYSNYDRKQSHYRGRSGSRLQTPSKERKHKQKKTNSPKQEFRSKYRRYSEEEYGVDDSPSPKRNEPTQGVLPRVRREVSPIPSIREKYLKKEASSKRRAYFPYEELSGSQQNPESRSNKSKNSRKIQTDLEGVYLVSENPSTPESGEYVSSPERKKRKHSLSKSKSKRKKRKDVKHSDADSPKAYKKNTDHHFSHNEPHGGERFDDGKSGNKSKHGKRTKEKSFIGKLAERSPSEEEHREMGRRSRTKKRRHEGERTVHKDSPRSLTRSPSLVPSHSKGKKKKHKRREENDLEVKSHRESKSKHKVSVRRTDLSPSQRNLPLKKENKSHTDSHQDQTETIKTVRKKKKEKRRQSSTSDKSDKKGCQIDDLNDHCVIPEEVLKASNKECLDISESPQRMSPEEDAHRLLEESLEDNFTVCSPSPSIPSLSPNSSQNVSFSQEIKETLSCAEEFVEQSRRRWKHRRKPSSDPNPSQNNSIAFSPTSVTHNLASDTIKPFRTDTPLKHGGIPENTPPQLDIFAESPTNGSSEATSPAFSVRKVVPDMVTEVSSKAQISKDASKTSCSVSVVEKEVAHEICNQSWLADTDHRTSTSLEKLHAPHHRAASEARSSCSKPDETAPKAMFLEHAGHPAAVAQPIKTVSGVSHLGEPASRDGTGFFDEDRVFEALASRFNQNKPSSTLIEVPMSEARDLSGASSDKLDGLFASSAKEVMVEKNSIMEVRKSAVNESTDTPSNMTEVAKGQQTIPLIDDVDKTRELKPCKNSDSIHAVLNPTQILNCIGLNPQQKSAAQSAILSIAELSKHLELDKIVKSVSEQGKAKATPTTVPSPNDNIESSAVEMYNKGKQQGFAQKIKFQERVAEEAKLAIKPYYERREISKAEYKEIMKRAVNKICSSESSMEVNSVKTRRLIRRYIEKYQQKNAFKKDRMRSRLSNEVSKHRRQESPPPPRYQPLSPPTQTRELPAKSEELKFGVGTPNLLKREPRKIVTLPDLPLPPPPPPPPPPMPNYRH